MFGNAQTRCGGLAVWNLSRLTELFWLRAHTPSLPQANPFAGRVKKKPWEIRIFRGCITEKPHEEHRFNYRLGYCHSFYCARVRRPWLNYHE